MENDNFIGLFNTKNYDVLEEAVNNILKEKCEELPKLKKCELKRLDFCFNAKFDNQEQVKAYIKTAKKANVPSKLDLYEQYDMKSKRTKPTKDDFTVYASEYVAISIYNKYMEMKKQKDGVFPASEIERAKTILRIELRCMEGILKYLKKKYSIKSISDFMDKSTKIGTHLYQYYLNKIFNDGDIYTLKESLKRISDSGYYPDNIALLSEFIRDCNESRSVAKTIKTYKSIYGKKEVKRIIYMLDNIETSYVTVSHSDEKLFNNGYIPTPLELFKEFMK